jgi:mono/diheme cytochrome c family protein
MAATDQTYRNQKALDIVFAVSCLLMLASVLWMFVQDYNREFKVVQREFRDVEEARNVRLMLEKLPDPAKVEEKRQAVVEARKALAAKRAELRPTERKLMATRDTRDDQYRTIKADVDSLASFYDIAVEHVGKASPGDRSKREQEAADLLNQLNAKRAQLADAQAKLDEVNDEFKREVTEKLKGAEGVLAQSEDDLKRLTGTFDRFAKATAQKKWTFGDTFRKLPILDAFESPTKIKQITLNDLTIDYGGFRDVPRYDRCTSCHLGIDRAIFDKASLESLTKAPEELVAKFKDARAMLAGRAKGGEDLGFSMSDFPTSVRTVKLTPGQITQYAAHPRLDLFVDGNSPHSAEKFGCTICHAGQGSATDFLLASHSPADAEQEKQWKKEYGWHAIHDWDFPMLSNRFVESGCLKCHYQVTDLISHGSKEEAPKVLRGYNLVREFGCFGCHEISGLKNNRWVGPDLRLEPQPALEYLTPGEQDKLKTDASNPPGQYRKVGPSLRRLAEKTNQEWARKWVYSPRGFRPDTKMPHFYNLSNNSKSAPDLPDAQKPFPDAEMHSIAFYLLAESKGSIEGKDSARTVLESEVKRLQDILAKRLLDERDRKALLDASRRLGDMALLSVPRRAREINAHLTRQRLLQDRLQELYKKQQDLQAKAEPEELSATEKKDLAAAGKELEEVTKEVIAAGLVVPLAKEITDEFGAVVTVPDAPKVEKEAQAHRDNGRRLFTEKGCLACHSHEGTAKRSEGFPAVEGHANFGPNLSRVAAKLTPEVGGQGAGRRWLIQWILNPTIYHARTRMPVTHLSADEAGDVADWLLSQKVTDWNEQGPANPTTRELVDLARVYLGKAPGMTAKDVDTFLPANSDSWPGVLNSRLAYMPPDADERRLEKVTDDNLKWYIGRKAITRLGCYGCHDVPGFENAKPIGTALNDWGKKDPDRLAFEDSAVFVRDHFNIVKQRNDPKEPGKPAADWRADDKGNKPFEEIFYQALEHHGREGFLHLKLEDPRSYDYRRLRTWDDRLRMPQFRFARAARRAGESDEEYTARQSLEEAEAREAVMTFILGLVADPVNLKYVYNPPADKLAEVKGRQVLDKFNCAGCHQVRSGVYEVKTTDDALQNLEKSYTSAAKGFAGDHFFMGNNAWAGAAQTSSERVVAFGSQPKNEEIDEQTILTVRLVDALRFTGTDKVMRDVPAGSTVRIAPKDLLNRVDPWGGTFTDLMIFKDAADTKGTGYLAQKYRQRFDGKSDDARSALPPPLIREGERVQPKWLYGFLLNPQPIRPPAYMLLRMPKFNMSEDDAHALADYFSGTSRLTNPGAGVTAPFLALPQRDEQFWRARTAEYVARLKKDNKLDGRAKEMGPLWEEALKKRVADAKVAVDVAKATVEDAKKRKDADAQKSAETQLATLEANVKKWQGQLDKKDFAELRQRWEAEGAYASDAYRLLHNTELCLKCHSIGGREVPGGSGPNLMLTAERLRPEWTMQWVANPARLYPYSPIMPQNFAADSVRYQEYFVGTPLQQVRAVRDVLMDLPRLAEQMPANRPTPPPAPAGGGNK